jgi:hypothetical protein
MKRIRHDRMLAIALSSVVTFGCAATSPSPPPAASSPAAILVSNNHEVPYNGPILVDVDLPDGTYRGAGGIAQVHAGVARGVTDVAARSDVVLSRTGDLEDDVLNGVSLAVTANGRGLDLEWASDRLGSMEFGLVVLPGLEDGPDDVPAAFDALDISWEEQPSGAFRAEVVRDGYDLEIIAQPYGGGWIDIRTRVTRVDETADPAYVAFVRRMTVPGMQEGRLRMNGRVLEGSTSPELWERDFWYTKGVDWVSWVAGDVSIAAINGFTPVPTILRNGNWVDASHFYVWERTRRDADQLYLISEIAGPNPGQATSSYMPITPYAPMRAGDSLDLKWRLAFDETPGTTWEESHLRVFAGYHSVAATDDLAVVDLGVPGVAFGTSYFPYSTLPENFDYYRTPGLNKETWWSFSPDMWMLWREFVPRMLTDLHIIRAMGFDWVRLHHLQLLREMDRAEALAFLDFYTAAARDLNLKILVDSEGPEEWIAELANRYGDDIQRYEIENEILILGIKPEQPARWKALYHAFKDAAPDADVFLTAAGNNAMFERLEDLDIPFDRVGLHAYKHGEEWKEAFSSHALGTGGYATDIGKQATLGEFNWKGFTRLSPEVRREEFIATYENMLQPRALPEFFQFHFQETLSVNPSISRSGIRHYETINLDRRPKPEAIELMRMIREYTSADAPVREVSIESAEMQFVDGSATAAFTITNNTARPLTLELSPAAFGDIESRLTSPTGISLSPGETAEATVEVLLGPDPEPGTYHHFLKIDYGDQEAYGWGVAANPGAPVFEAEPVLDGYVVYPQGAAIVERIEWDEPLAVAFGPDAPVLEMEMAYILGNTLQSATGRPVRISSTADLTNSWTGGGGTLILVGTATSNPLIGAAADPRATGKGIILLRDPEDGGQRLLLTGDTEKAVQAAATDFVLRYWQNAKDAAIRITGMAPGAALGNKAEVTNPDPQ